LGNLKKFSSDTLIYGLGTGLKKFIGLFLLPFYARALSPADYGILDSLATFSFFISAIVGVGIDSASGFYFFEARTDNEKGEILFTTFLLRLFTAIPSLILGIFSSSISSVVFGTDKYALLVLLSCMTIPTTFLLNEQSQIYRFFREPWKFNIITIVKSLSSIALGISLVVILKYGIFGALVAAFASNVIVIVFSFFFYTRKKYSYSFNWAAAKKMFIFGYPLIWAGIVEWVYVSSDRFFLLHYTNLTEIGYYSIGTTFSQPIGMINMAVQMSFGVLFLEIYNNESQENGKKFAGDIFKIYIVISVTLASLISVFSTSIVPFVTTEAYAMGSLSIPFLTYSMIFSQGQQIVGSGIYINKKTWHYGWLVSVSAILNIILNFILIPRWGFVAAGLTTLVSYFAYFLLSYFVSQIYLPIEYNLGKILAYLLIAFLIAAFVPFAELKALLKLSVTFKFLLFFIILALPFLFGLISKKTVLDLKKVAFG